MISAYGVWILCILFRAVGTIAQIIVTLPLTRYFCFPRINLPNSISNYSTFSFRQSNKHQCINSCAWPFFNKIKIISSTPTTHHNPMPKWNKLWGLSGHSDRFWCLPLSWDYQFSFAISFRQGCINTVLSSAFKLTNVAVDATADIWRLFTFVC